MAIELRKDLLRDRKNCYEALRARDARFDGLFFVGVKTTKIYCRNVCRAKLPFLENCRFFANAASAEAHGYRPCLRCRPELAPGHAPIDSANRLAILAMNRIEDGALTEGNLEDLAREMGISSRHLRRVVEAEFGVSPLQLAQTQRLLLAKRLLTDTCLPVTEVAFAGGYSSVRRFNAAFQDHYCLSPSELRRKGSFSAARDNLTCDLSYRPPYDWNSLLSFLKARACPGVELVLEDKYVRTAAFGEHKGWLIVEHHQKKNAITVTVSITLAPVLLQCLARVKRLFDLQTNLSCIETRLGELCVPHAGLRVPGAFDGFEVAVRAILGQQISVHAATVLAGRLAQRFGDPVTTPFAGLTHIHPTAERLSSRQMKDFHRLGIMAPRVMSIQALSQLMASAGLSLQPGADVENAKTLLKSLPGVGDWTVEYIAMRALSWPDAFPHSDLGIKKALPGKNAREILQISEKWRPWRAYAAMHLWKSLESAQ